MALLGWDMRPAARGGGFRGWDPAQPWAGNGSQREWGHHRSWAGGHLLQHHQAPVHQQRPGQSFGSLVADLIFCQAAQKKDNSLFFQRRKRLAQSLACPRMQLGWVSREEPWGAFGTSKVMDVLLGWTPGRDCKDTVSGHKIHLCPIKELRWQHGGLCAALRKRRRWGKWEPICLG